MSFQFGGAQALPWAGGRLQSGPEPPSTSAGVRGVSNLRVAALGRRLGRRGPGPGLRPRRLPRPAQSGDLEVRHAAAPALVPAVLDRRLRPPAHVLSRLAELERHRRQAAGPGRTGRTRPRCCPRPAGWARTIGPEWARDKKVRRIDTGDLHVFKGQLEASGDALRGVDKVEASVRAKLAR